MADCVRFEYTPSEYIDKKAPTESDYYTLMVCDAKGAFVRLRLKDGTSVWAKTNAPDAIRKIGRGGGHPIRFFLNRIAHIRLPPWRR